jgi:hypothetical protein
MRILLAKRLNMILRRSIKSLFVACSFVCVLGFESVPSLAQKRQSPTPAAVPGVGPGGGTGMGSGSGQGLGGGTAIGSAAGGDGQAGLFGATKSMTETPMSFNLQNLQLQPKGPQKNKPKRKK